MRLTDADVACLARWSENEGYAETLRSTDIEALAKEVQEYRALRSVMEATLRDVNARLITPYDALARIVMELASLDTVGTTDGR